MAASLLLQQRSSLPLIGALRKIRFRKGVTITAKGDGLQRQRQHQSMTLIRDLAHSTSIRPERSYLFDI